MSDLWSALKDNWYDRAVSKIAKKTVELLVLIVKEEVSDDVLKGIREDLKKLIRKHYDVGLRYFQEFCLTTNPDLRRRLLHDARRAFSEAASVDAPLQCARATRLVAVCYDLLGEKKIAHLRYEEAYRKAMEHYKKLLPEFEDTVATQATNILLGVSLVGQPLMYARWTRKYMMRQKLEEEAKATRGFLYETRVFLFGRELEIQPLYERIAEIPPYSWSGT